MSTYPPEIEHAGTIEKCIDNDRERDQGQSKAKASPEKVEKEAKKERGVSHQKKFRAKATNGHHRDYILLLFVGLAQRAPLFVFFFFLSDSEIVSHSQFASKSQNRF